LVTEPGVQLVQALALDAVEYNPGAQGLHWLDPGELPLLATAPAWHLEQAAVGACENQPASHAVQLLAPALISVLVIIPGAHPSHKLAVPLAVVNRPGGQPVQASVATIEYCPGRH
jgi:hypothetical protein